MCFSGMSKFSDSSDKLVELEVRKANVLFSTFNGGQIWQTLVLKYVLQTSISAWSTSLKDESVYEKNQLY